MGAPDVQLPSVGPEEGEVTLYDPDILTKLDWSKVTHMKNGVTSATPGEGLLVRPLCKADYDRGFLQLLGQLTKIGDISREKFNERFEAMRSCPGHYYVTVIEDTQLGQIVGSATLACELKFIRDCAKVGIVTTITLLAGEVGCYKMGLDCKDEMKLFYRSLGYSSEKGNDNTMIIRF
ncbi:glucosamine 6-phosphate N-acetyltransferase-like [Homarus americanus]|uniref:Glucosamine 6-phosphate N-acetyltransferase n=1 Tax=Homarus americanus TaxID=6706 RepID=A0A8J5MXV2_HOMAM|nr:glucosamine 6-phosphate N-acetyltransferase-like [Homarus americanus]